MQFLDLNILVAATIVVILSLIAGYIGEKVEPIDAAALLIAVRVTESRGSERYLSPGQVASILLPRSSRRLRGFSHLASLLAIILALVTQWWLLIVWYVARQVMASVTWIRFTNRSLDHNCFWIVADLDLRKDEFVNKGDLERAEAVVKLMQEINPIWESASVEDELVPRRDVLMKTYGVRATL